MAADASRHSRPICGRGRSSLVGATVLYMSMSLDGFITGPNAARTTASATAASGFTNGPFTGAEGGDSASPRQAERRQPPGLRGVHVDGRRHSGPPDLRARGRVGRRPSRRRPHLHPQPPRARNRHRVLAAGQLRRRRRDRVRRGTRAAGEKRRTWSTARQPRSSHSPRASSMSSTSTWSRCFSGKVGDSRRPRCRARRARAHPYSRGGERRQPSALPGPPLSSHRRRRSA